MLYMLYIRYIYMYLPYLTLPSKLVRYQVCFHLSCFSLPYLLLPTYMPDKPDRPDIYYKGPV